MSAPLSAGAVAALLAERMPELARDLIGEPTQRSRDAWRFRARGSLSVQIAGAKRGSWFDHEAGEGGDALGLVAHLHRQPMGAAYAWALGWLGLAGDAEAHIVPRPAPAPPEAARNPPPPATLDLARAIWREAVAPGGTLVEAYLASRGLQLEPDAPIRFHPACPRGAERLPAMVALMSRETTAEPCGVHRTFLAPDGRGKAPGQAKMMAGEAGCIRLVPDEDVTLGLGLAEGIETALSVMQNFQWRPVWAAASAGAVARFPVLPAVALTIFADTGEAGIAAAEACASRWAEAGREARICVPPGGDFNDLARERAT